MAEAYEVLLRTAAAYALIMLMTRLLGKRTISKMTYHDYVAATMVGTIAANMAFNVKIGSNLFVLSFIVLTLISFVILLIQQRSKTMRKLIDGKPVPVIENGRLMDDKLKELHMTRDAVMQELRGREIFDINDVEQAVLEKNGKLSICRKPEFRPATKADLNPLLNRTGLAVELIVDGRIVEGNLVRNGLRKEWLLGELEAAGFLPQRVGYAVLGSDKRIHVGDTPSP